jgi:hypothetical protein
MIIPRRHAVPCGQNLLKVSAGRTCTRPLLLSLVLWLIGITPAPADSNATNAPTLALKVTPRFAFAPADVSFTATVPRDPENRALSVAVDSGAFYRATTIQLDGSAGPVLNSVFWKGLPAGQYDVQAVLMGTRGTRAVVRKSIQIYDSPLPR